MSSDVLRAEDPLLSDPPPKFDPRLGKLLYPEDSRRGSKPAPDPKWNVYPRYFCVVSQICLPRLLRLLSRCRCMEECVASLYDPRRSRFRCSEAFLLKLGGLVEALHTWLGMGLARPLS